MTDGQIHDAPESADALELAAPFHVLLSGRDDEIVARASVVDVVDGVDAVVEPRHLDPREPPRAAHPARRVGSDERVDHARQCSGRPDEGIRRSLEAHRDDVTHALRRRRHRGDA